MLIREAIIAAGLLIGLFGANSARQSAAPKFTDLSREDAAGLDKQRAVVAAAAKVRYGTTRLTRTKDDLPVLQRMIDDKVFSKSQTYEWQCLGVAFGDVLTSDIALRWVIVTDEYGTGPTLRLRNTTINVNALTMISKRVERGDPVNLAELLRVNHEQVTRMEREFAR